MSAAIGVGMGFADGLAQGSAGWEANRARSEARDILSERRFRGVDPPRPLEGVLEGVGRWIRQTFESIADFFPGGETGLWTVLGVVVVLLAIVLSVLVARRRIRGGADRVDTEVEGLTSVDIRRLEREADQAERRGQFDRAIRLRFRAGLLRLGRSGAIEWHPSLTSGQVSRRLRLSVFDNIARVFDEIVYGRRQPTESDVDESRAGWARVLGEVGR